MLQKIQQESNYFWKSQSMFWLAFQVAVSQLLIKHMPVGVS